MGCLAWGAPGVAKGTQEVLEDGQGVLRFSSGWVVRYSTDYEWHWFADCKGNEEVRSLGWTLSHVTGSPEPLTLSVFGSIRSGKTAIAISRSVAPNPKCAEFRFSGQEVEPEFMAIFERVSRRLAEQYEHETLEERDLVRLRSHVGWNLRLMNPHVPAMDRGRFQFPGMPDAGHLLRLTASPDGKKMRRTLVATAPLLDVVSIPGAPAWARAVAVTSARGIYPQAKDSQLWLGLGSAADSKLLRPSLVVVHREYGADWTSERGHDVLGDMALLFFDRAPVGETTYYELPSSVRVPVASQLRGGGYGRPRNGQVSRWVPRSRHSYFENIVVQPTSTQMAMADTGGPLSDLQGVLWGVLSGLSAVDDGKDGEAGEPWYSVSPLGTNMDFVFCAMAVAKNGVPSGDGLEDGGTFVDDRSCPLLEDPSLPGEPARADGVPFSRGARMLDLWGGKVLVQPWEPRHCDDGHTSRTNVFRRAFYYYPKGAGFSNDMRATRWVLDAQWKHRPLTTAKDASVHGAFGREQPKGGSADWPDQSEAFVVRQISGTGSEGCPATLGQCSCLGMDCDCSHAVLAHATKDAAVRLGQAVGVAWDVLDPYGVLPPEADIEVTEEVEQFRHLLGSVRF